MAQAKTRSLANVAYDADQYVKSGYKCSIGMVALRRCRRSRGPPPRRPGRSNMDVRQTEHPLVLLYLVRAARQLRHTARPLRTASAVVGQ